MHELRRFASLLALLLFAACTAQKNSRHDAAAAQAKTAAQTSRPTEKSTTPRHAPSAAAKNTGLPAGEVGYYMDVLQGRLQQQLDPAVVVARENDSIVLDFSRRFGFTVDTAQLNDTSRDLLAPLAKILGEYRAARVVVRVSAEDNAAAAAKLAQMRAGAIERLLINAGVASARVTASVATAPVRDGDAHLEIVLLPETRRD